MHSCSLHKLAQNVSPDNSKTLNYRLSHEKLSQLSELRLKSLYDKKPDYAAISTQPWKSSPKYFKNVLISSLALVKMSMHAKSGGSIEIMGMLTGKVIGTSIIVMDVYSLPVEGTETRVNAQNEAYEYMVQYLDLMNSAGREEHIVGWYHSHPGYGCWLSGIDVATQSLNQNFQDPYLAIVVDPVQSSNQGKIEIGAFRTLPMEYETREESKGKNVNIRSKEKMKDFGIHADQYYALDIELFKSKNDEECINMILNKSWASNLFNTESSSLEYDRRLVNRVEQLLSDLTFARERKESTTRESVMFNARFEDMVKRPLPGQDIPRADRIIREIFSTRPDQGESDEEVVGEHVEGDVEDEDDDDDDDEDEEDDDDGDEEQTSKAASDDQEETGVEDEASQTMDTDGNQSFEEEGEQLEIGNAKKRLHSTEDSRTSLFRENDRQQQSMRKRVATGDADSKLSNELKAKTQKAHNKLREEEKHVAGVGHAELLQMLVKRAQRKVFG
ncbi:hypothetical protein FT663_04264 [Candidozyma haemuli var. vulneris]|uniref:COP9 signalosome complex subunit 5 n=1 Tax=Candidozyma haemuli TaxID=45357 RepID=A0A2V1AS53_9ASCO|nr:hypothetical protein CXQ85_003629 [[Candida] haemuloni]KAF3986762.1 hypothetical protein FT662_04372 [[Candida] haemuloni var. vulneris]KAF3987871.1 hypothetical protein FT663_04264 [[Candida] haemuloni var. vulneris]PVH19771.1 hypothetical protein CXQ85_003629 [[Candida] haemuloni]